jgi:hypothetical protein
MNRCIYAYRLAMLKTGSAIAVVITPVAILPILYRIIGTATNTHRSIASGIVMATIMTEMIATTEGIEMAVTTEMRTVMAVAMANTRVAKAEIN